MSQNRSLFWNRAVVMIALAPWLPLAGNLAAAQSGQPQRVWIDPNQSPDNSSELTNQETPIRDPQLSWAHYSADQLSKLKPDMRVASRWDLLPDSSATGELRLSDPESPPRDDATAPPVEWTAAIQSQVEQLDWRKMVGSLALVIGGYLAIVFLLRRLSPQSARGIPHEVIEIVGTARLDAKHQLQLIRLGSKLLLISMGPDGPANIGEISSPEEVEYLVSLCGRKGRSRATTLSPRGDGRKPSRPEVALESLVQSLQAAVRKQTGHAEFEA